MTDPLATLLQREAADLDVPTAPAASILVAGRRARRRRQGATVAGSGLFALVAVAGVALGLAALGGDDPAGRQRGVDPATAAYLDHGVFATGSTIHLGDGSTAEVAEKVKVLYYTSAGPLVRTGLVSHTDDDGPSHYTLVRPDATQSTLDLDLGDRIPATDPTQPLLAFAEAAGGPRSWQVVVLDVTTGQERARVDVEGSLSGGWEAPPVALDGDLVYVSFDDGATTAVDWRQGEVVPYSGDGPAVGGRVVETVDDQARVVDLATGAVLYSVSTERYPYIDLSPDGELAKVVFQDEQEDEGFLVVDLDSGRTTTITEAPWDFGWTAGGHLFSVDTEAGTTTTCAPVSGTCDEQDVAGSVQGPLKLAGLSYES
ncbi:hypothetical protein I601_2420 [Nocardioides dokdonensis FR1436]|uniref:Uncharacterized protein n=1 Tax=Nocardioides dokdonensis FR1436 TaxID=1300347 RepID=A0A1A9GKM1_9ACTN|nr:hypothetical protein [Nocardioides dokdonensis]ANH38838.1 hypothetical protein I601_2420 [Nocardioides dokdonensis FR1436]